VFKSQSRTELTIQDGGANLVQDGSERITLIPYLAKIEASFKDNLKEFWSYHKVFKGGRSCTNSAICNDGEVAYKTGAES